MAGGWLQASFDNGTWEDVPFYHALQVTAVLQGGDTDMRVMGSSIHSLTCHRPAIIPPPSILWRKATHKSCALSVMELMSRSQRTMTGGTPTFHSWTMKLKGTNYYQLNITKSIEPDGIRPRVLGVAVADIMT